MWWDLIVSLTPSPDSIQSGAIVPCTRYFAPNSFASLSKMRMNFSPMAFLFCSGSVIPFKASKYSFDASTDLKLMPVSLNIASTSSASPLRIRPVSTNTASSLSPMALPAMTADTELSTPPEQAMIALPWVFSFTEAIASCMNLSASNTGEHLLRILFDLLGLLFPVTE